MKNCVSHSDKLIIVVKHCLIRHMLLILRKAVLYPLDNYQPVNVCLSSLSTVANVVLSKQLN